MDMNESHGSHFARCFENVQILLPPGKNPATKPGTEPHKPTETGDRPRAFYPYHLVIIQLFTGQKLAEAGDGAPQTYRNRGQTLGCGGRGPTKKNGNLAVFLRIISCVSRWKKFGTIEALMSKIDRREFLKKMGKLSAVAGSVMLGGAAGCYDDMDYLDGYTDYTDLYRDGYTDYLDYSDGYFDGYADYGDGYLDSYNDYGDGYADGYSDYGDGYSDFYDDYSDGYSDFYDDYGDSYLDGYSDYSDSYDDFYDDSYYDYADYSDYSDYADYSDWYDDYSDYSDYSDYGDYSDW